MSLIKICGLTREEDVKVVRDGGADFAGFVLAPSPRRIEPDRAAELVRLLDGSSTQAVGVFVNEDPAVVREIAHLARFSIVQLHGEETSSHKKTIGLPVIRAFGIEKTGDLEGTAAFPADFWLFDTRDRHKRGGTGRSFRWEILQETEPPRPFLLAGGLSPDNVTEAIRVAAPDGVDVSTGVEASPGFKDPRLVREFIERARAAFSERGEER